LQKVVEEEEQDFFLVPMTGVAMEVGAAVVDAVDNADQTKRQTLESAHVSDPLVILQRRRMRCP